MLNTICVKLEKNDNAKSKLIIELCVESNINELDENMNNGSNIMTINDYDDVDNDNNIEYDDSKVKIV